MRKTPRDVLKAVFGFPQFRGGQERAVDALVAGNDALVLLPTGAGKSLCYQVPAVLAHKTSRATAVVVSPLIALMNDQVSSLQGLGVSAEAIHSNLARDQQREIESRLLNQEIALLYVSPERATSDWFLRMIGNVNVSLNAIDEAHCLSQWGHDFRPSYMSLNKLTTQVKAPTIALTATATAKVFLEISKRLGLKTPETVIGDFSRPNLKFSVHPLSKDKERLGKLVEIMRERGFNKALGEGRALIYCSTRKRTEMVASELTAAGINCGAYHAGKEKEKRDQIQRAFAARKYRVLAATNAFGMGIDYPDIRVSLHFDAPGDLSAYYQEAGRAGRDRQPAECILFFGERDLMTQRRIQGSKKGIDEALSAVRSYAYSQDCRQLTICRHFNPTVKSVSCIECDVCLGETPTAPKPQAPPDVSQDLLDKVLEAVGNLPFPIGRATTCKMLRGSRAQNIVKLNLHEHEDFGRFKRFKDADITQAIALLIEEGKVSVSGTKYPTIWLTGKARPTRGRKRTTTLRSKPIRARANPRKFSDIRRGLDNYRRRMAKQLQWKPYMVFQKRVITAIDDNPPTSLDDLARVPGLGPAKIERFGEDILEIVRSAQR